MGAKRLGGNGIGGETTRVWGRNDKANSSDTEAPFLDLNLPITNGIVSLNGMILILK